MKEVHLRESQTKIEKSKGKNWGSDQIYFQTKFEELCGTFHAHCSDSLVDCFWISWVSKMTQFILIRISVKTERSRKKSKVKIRGRTRDDYYFMLVSWLFITATDCLTNNDPMYWRLQNEKSNRLFTWGTNQNSISSLSIRTQSLEFNFNVIHLNNHFEKSHDCPESDQAMTRLKLKLNE